jgi:hypothetical protein
MQSYTTFHLPHTIHSIRNATPTPPLQLSGFRFERSQDAATHNTLLLQSHNFDTNAATQSTPNTVLTYGSEFKPSHLLAPLLQRHHHWPKIKNIIDNGMSYPLRDISEQDRIADIKFMLDRGNHKSAQLSTGAKALSKAFDKEVKYQWAIPLQPHCIKYIPGASVTPLGVATQWSINAQNERIIKRRTTHDCSFPGPSGLSCNMRVIKDLVDECTYGHAFKRFLHGIHQIRRNHPTSIIWMNKTDMDAAYRRLHTNMTAAVTCITVVDEIAYLLTRVPFGAAPAPAGFSLVSDAAGDLSQDLASDPSWDPHSLRSSFHLDFPPRQEADDVPFGQADELAVNLPPRKIVTDNFIDDLFQACLHEGDNAERIKHAVPLILETLFRPLNPKDASPRDDIINMTKHEAEGRLEEKKTILGWSIDSRRFRVLLTPDKAREWLLDITLTIKTGRCTHKLLESIIGRLNHTSVIIHLGRYFLTRLRYRLKVNSPPPSRHTQIKLAQWDLEDLRLWKFILTHLSTFGTSINNICFSAPSAITYSDACEWGIGGFTTQGFAWRWLIPKHLQRRASINFLEFLGSILAIETCIQFDKHHTQHPHILAFTDNSSALGWLYHSTFNPVLHKNHDKLARYLAKLLFKKEATLHAEHIPGTQNVIADSLSRDFHLTHTDLTTLILSHAPPEQVPPTFTIQSLPPHLSSWASSMLESLPPTTASPPRQAPSSLALSPNTKPSSSSATSPTPSSNPTPTPSANSSYPHSLTATAQTGTNQQQKTDFKAALSRAPSQMWFRLSGKTFGLTPPEMQTGNPAPSFTDK